MKSIATLFAAALLLAGCSGSSSDDTSPERTTASPNDVSTSFDRDALEQQAKDQAEQKERANDDLAGAVRDEAREDGVVVAINVKDGKVTPLGKRVEVKVGQRIYLDMTSDTAEEIHVHSEPEHSYELTPGDTATKSFTIGTPGQVAVEAHHLDVTIVQLVVRP